MGKYFNIVITGGGTGIGAALTKELSKEGHTVFTCGRRVSKLKEVSKVDNNIFFKACDVSNEEDVIDFLKFVKHKIDYIDVLINCAGIFGPIDRFDKTDSLEWKRTFEINTYGTYLIAKHFLHLILNSDTKKIINFSGGGAFSPFPNYSAYAVSKAALVRFSENLAVELAEEGVTVNCIAPGFVATDLHKSTIKAGEKKAGMQYDLTIKKLQKGAVPVETVVDCIKFLISSQSDGLTGKTISASFDKWGTNIFKKSIDRLNQSDLYTLQRINLRNLDNKNYLRKKLSDIEDNEG